MELNMHTDVLKSTADLTCTFYLKVKNMALPYFKSKFRIQAEIWPAIFFKQLVPNVFNSSLQKPEELSC